MMTIIVIMMMMIVIVIIISWLFIQLPLDCDGCNLNGLLIFQLKYSAVINLILHFIVIHHHDCKHIEN